MRILCKGKCKGDPRKKNVTDKNLIDECQVPVISLGYSFPRDKKENRATEQGMPILVMKNTADKWTSAFVVPQKGSNEYAIKAVAREIQNAGHNRIIIKSDQEPAVKELVNAVKRERAEKIELESFTEEESPVGESSSNGMVERAIQDVQGQMRTMKLATE